MSQLLASDIILHPKHPEGVTADLRTWPLLDSYGESALAQLLCMGILGPQPAASHAPGAVHRHQTPKHTLHFPYGNPCTMAKATLPSGMSIFSSANRFSKKWREFRMSTCHSNGNRTQTLSSHWRTQVCVWVISFEQPLWALQMDTVFSPEMSFS